jgi:hypothetical protein
LRPNCAYRANSGQGLGADDLKENRRGLVRRLLKQKPIVSSRSRLFKPRLTSLRGNQAEQSSQVTFEIARSKTLMTRSLRSGTAAMISGILFLAPLGNVAAQDANSDAQTVLKQARSQIQNMVISMSQGCSGGARGVPPVSWAQLQPHANSAVNALDAAVTALAQDQKPNAANVAVDVRSR